MFIFRYSWIKDGQIFDWKLYNDRITQQPGRGTLVIKSPRDEDVGKTFFKLLIYYIFKNKYILLYNTIIMHVQYVKSKLGTQIRKCHIFLTFG